MLYYVFASIIIIVILLIKGFSKSAEIQELVEKNNKLTTQNENLINNETQYALLLLNYKKSYLETQRSIEADYKTLKNEHPDTFTYIASLMADYFTYSIHKDAIDKYENNLYFKRSNYIKEESKKTITDLKIFQYQLDYILMIHPEIKNELSNKSIETLPCELEENKKIKNTKKEVDLKLSEERIRLQNEFNQKLKEERDALKKQYEVWQKEFLSSLSSNLSAIPYTAAILADYQTYGIEVIAKQLDWGCSVERSNKVASIREIRNKAKQDIKSNNEARYQLAYLLKLFPNLEDILETDYNELKVIDIDNITEYDKTRDWLSSEEYKTLNSVERNQLALDRYKTSHNKSRWQIGRDYELYVGYRYSQKGYSVDFFGSYMGLEDLGRDLIAKKDDTTLIIQCKYWSQDKEIHEKHITQLYGTVASYCIENSINKKLVKGILVTNTQLSDMAKKMANFLKINYVEKYEKGDYPCIKCNIGHNNSGVTKIYHLPFDQQYDHTKIDINKGEFYAMTVKEAEDAGFRRALKWFNK